MPSVKSLPKLGLLLKDGGPATPGDGALENAASWPFPIETRVVKGLTTAALEGSADVPADVAAAVDAALAELKAAGCVAVASNLTSALKLQAAAFSTGGGFSQAFFSPLLQLPTLLCGFGDDDKILVISSHTKAELAENSALCRQASGVEPFGNLPQLAVLTLEAALADDAVVAEAKKAIAADPAIKAIVLERASLASAGDALRDATGLGVYEGFTCGEAFMAGYLDNPRFGEDGWQQGTAADQDAISAANAEKLKAVDAAKTRTALSKRKGQDRKASCSIGVVRLDYDYPAAKGDIDHPGSYEHDVYYRAVPRLTFTTCQGGPSKKRPSPDAADGWDAEVEADYFEAIDWLVNEKKVSVIAADCGFFMWFQSMARARVQGRPVTMSSLAMLPTLVAALAPDRQIAIFTANSTSLEPMRDLIQKECGLENAGITLDDERLLIVGCQDVPYFGPAVQAGDKVDVEKVIPHMVALAEQTVKDHPKVAAFLFECTELPPYSDSVRSRCNLPVYDAITTVQFFLSGFADNPRVGKEGWQDAWDGTQDSFYLGKNATAEDKAKFENPISSSA
eukprot:CAMPEP_0185702294 /NCGR_PEP_ID=MMETSP1164-20130828/11454_1 /TAXON_ID=1104430 /ORGANISM="Chrysoreinhardia sp, Strain CCMP2950" /LENGTH=566 /DNA_ID=CAMNT_0028369471 /DNA_START=48 /DNA_END=1748 /DNA_ORIENTATION=-